MSTKNTLNGTNVFESTLGGLTVRGKAHGLSAWFVLALRLMMGYAFLHAGYVKIVAAEPFSAVGYLTNAVPEASPKGQMV
jgi:thiosulfate dehydrogenase [quinone] large subunit